MEILEPSRGGLDLPPRRLPGLLLEAVEEDDASPRGEGVDDPVDVRVALDPQLPQLGLEVADQRLSRRDVALDQQLDGPPQSGLGFEVEAFKECPHRGAPASLDVEDDRPCPSLHADPGLYAFQYMTRSL